MSKKIIRKNYKGDNNRKKNRLFTPYGGLFHNFKYIPKVNSDNLFYRRPYYMDFPVEELFR